MARRQRASSCLEGEAVLCRSGEAVPAVPYACALGRMTEGTAIERAGRQAGK